MSKKHKTAEQINREVRIAITPDDKTVGGYYHNVICPECKANIRQQLIGEIVKLIRKDYIPGEDADILIEDLQQFKEAK